MRLGRVVGRVVVTRKDPGLAAQRLLLVQPIDGQGNALGRAQVMTDVAGAGAGEVVFYVRGREASFPYLPDNVPADSTVLGVVDHYSWRGTERAGITPVEP